MIFLAMEIDPGIYQLINLLLKVVLTYLIIASPIVLTILLVYGYGRYKKWKDIEVKEKEKIIVGQAKDILKNDEDIRWQHDEKLRLAQDIDIMNRRKKELQDELGVSDNLTTIDSSGEIDLNKLNIKQLKALAKERGLTMYSKKNKQQLIVMLQG